MIEEPQPVGDRAQHVLEPLGGMTRAVERATEFEHESDGDRVGLVAAALERHIKMVGHGCSGLGAPKLTTARPSS